jgi:hypothetical protein
MGRMKPFTRISGALAGNRPWLAAVKDGMRRSVIAGRCCGSVGRRFASGFCCRWMRVNTQHRHRLGSALAIISGALAVLVVAGCTSSRSMTTTTVLSTTIPHTKAAAHPSPLTRTAWQADMAHVPAPGPGCYRASYPALTWHAVKCGVAPKVPS